MPNLVGSLATKNLWLKELERLVRGEVLILSLHVSHQVNSKPEGFVVLMFTREVDFPRTLVKDF